MRVVSLQLQRCLLNKSDVSLMRAVSLEQELCLSDECGVS